MIKFFDTSALLNRAYSLQEEEGPFVVSSITLAELENIKTSAKKDEDIKSRARVAARYLKDHHEAKCYLFFPSMLEAIEPFGLEINNDIKILASAIRCNSENPIEFITGDTC